MLDGYDADPVRLRDRAVLTGLLDTIPTLLGMHPIAPAQVVEVGPNNRKDPGGLSGFVMIAESHISFHTFPERGFVTIGLYTCCDTIDRARVVRLLVEAFAIASVDVLVQGRGLRYPMTDLAECGSVVS
jgi:S-adenosylmethionine decarboxylase